MILEHLSVALLRLMSDNERDEYIALGLRIVGEFARAESSCQEKVSKSPMIACLLTVFSMMKR